MWEEGSSLLCDPGPWLLPAETDLLTKKPRCWVVEGGLRSYWVEGLFYLVLVLIFGEGAPSDA